LKYRAEIDGLRALAVIPVILFHAGFELFSGGFVGVDVFFVISGYLITTILIEDIENKRFSIVNFYERRARRILPALFFVMLVCIPFAWMWMLPSQMKDFSQSLVAVSLFASNILFWRESGYFDVAAEEKPLLHTWSLAVEEQYYMLFPIFLILAWRFGKNRVFWMIVVMAAISLLLSEWGWRKHPTANFYLAPTRAWELFSGSIAAFIVQKQGVQKNNVLATLGLALIVFSILFYDETTPFPSVYALVPVLGVVLLVLYAEKETITAKLLSTKGFVGIGLISYSAYLWHQPLFAFARIRSFEHPSALTMFTLSVASLLLAFISSKYIEMPFRFGRYATKWTVIYSSLFGIALFLSMGLTGHFVNGTLTRLTMPANIAYESLGNRISYERLPCNWSSGFDDSDAYDGCIFGDIASLKNIVLVGDSHSQALSYVLNEWAVLNQKRVVWLKMNGCEYMPNLVRNYKSPRVDCNANHEEMISLIKALDADVILSFRWTFRMYPIDEIELDMPYQNSFGDVESETYREYFVYENGNFNTSSASKRRLLENFVTSIASASRTLFLVHPVPETAIDIFKRNFRYWASNGEILPELFIRESDYNSRNKFVVNIFDSLTTDNVVHIRPQNLFCDESKCFLQMNGVPLYLDDDHLGDNGARLIVNEIFSSAQ